ncbi:NAD(P)-dependent alcohol dehydrogenase [Desulfosporosinus sp.]|uniref:NAD(P)-dependent alcohol dehydrogenase n=1 Tax=Desulfosporosinus sp. TaxID=157907 RepID=UPI0025C206A2|nr:NAD(P)-dependent alcohol dehydrogenase [Desulfosporosinus sp.]MBC2727789.1 NAD(P)-dependent alcohol dehydrogenase [Desulfosporosinus sp.]
MKAIVCTKYGSPDVLELKEVEKPAPKDNEVLVKVHAASLNAADVETLRGVFWVRIGGPLKPMYKILGSDIAGRVAAVGRNVKQFQPSDEVFGDLSVCGFGAFAEYVSVPENALRLKPDSMTFEEAATYPQAAILALQGLRDKGQIEPGQKVLINGAGGGVGTFAVQIVKYFGAEVTGVDSTRKLDMLCSIGTDQVIDYTQEDFTKSGQRYDLILDVVAYRSIFDYKRALSPKGIYVFVGGSTAAIFQALFLGPLISMTGSRKMGIVMWKPNKKEDLVFLKKLFEAGKVVPVIDRCYPLSEVPEALRYLEEGHAQGKVVITM